MAQPTPEVIRILAFDPAIGEMGWAVLEHTPKTKTTLVLKHGIIKGDKVSKERRKIMLPEFSKQYTVLCAIRDVVAELIREERPAYVVSEGPFAHRFVQAYASLKLVVDRLRQATHEIMNRNLHEVQPTEAKFDAAGKGTAKKDEVKAGLLANKKIKLSPAVKTSIKHATEHEIDAIAVGHCFISRQLSALTQTKN